MMSVERQIINPDPEATQATPNFWAKARRLGLGMLSTAVAVVGVHEWDIQMAQNQANQVYSAIGNIYDVQPQDITGHGLHTIKPLSGPGNTVKPAQRRELEDATVAVLSGVPGDEYWSADGTGTKVAYDGHDYVLTAQHLFNFNYDSPLSPRAADLLKGDSSMEYAIANPLLTNRERDDDREFAKVTGAAFMEQVQTSGADIALLKVKPSYYEGQQHTFNDLKAIPMKQHFLAPPKPGQQVYMYGLPSPNLRAFPVGATGTYLGRAMLNDIEDNYEDVDVVGVNVKNSINDGCEHGGSGENFIAADDYVSGTLFYSARSSSERLPFQEYADEPGEITMRWELQKALHANLADYSDICAFTVLPRSYPHELIKGFNQPVDPFKH